MLIDRRRLIARLGVAGAAGMLTGCDSLGALNVVNTLVAGDRDVVRRVDGAAYGADPRQKLDVYAPATLGGAAPVLIFFYGGAWNSGYRRGYEFVARAFAARGFVVVIPDYRLVPQVRFPAVIDDGAAAVRWTVDHVAGFGGDPGRIAVAGHSAGAYIAMMLALDARYLVAVGAAGRIRAVAGLAGPYDFLPLDEPSAIAAFGHAADAKATQPIQFVRAGAPPVLLLTGDADDTVRPRNSIALAAALKAAGVPVELKVYPRLGHVDLILAVSKPFRGKGDVVETVVRFLTRFDC